MSRVCRWLAEKTARMLPPDDRDAVLGDLAELGASGFQSLRELLGLIARKQWRPGLALAGLACQAYGLLLIFVRGPAIYFNIWWRYGVRYEDGLSPARDFVFLACYCLALISCFWTSGVALACFSRPKIRVPSLAAAAMLTINVLAIWTSTWPQAALETWSGGAIHAKFVWQLQVLRPFALLNWPVAYLAANALRRPRRAQ